jgi:pantoate--beta-alanine ligase
MRILRDPASMQRQALKWLRAGTRIGFVPTMGYLHEGHISLVHEARRRVGASGVVVLSIYVNPTQFGPKEDFTKYPRDFRRDCRLCREAGVDVVFTPSDDSMYPGREAGDYSTYVVEEMLTQGMEGVSRPTHFRGVTTIVAKLFHCVLPEVAVFGAKDWQQAAVVSRMTRDLNFPVRIVVAETRREPDGLAMSSRNRYLDPDQRRQATVLSEMIALAREEVARAKRPIPSGKLRERLAGLVVSRPAARIDYIEFFHPETLRPLERVGPGTHLALAVFVGATRLIDNGSL